MPDARFAGIKTFLNTAQKGIPDILKTIAKRIHATGKAKKIKTNANASFNGRRHRQITM